MNRLARCGFGFVVVQESAEGGAAVGGEVDGALAGLSFDPAFIEQGAGEVGAQAAG
jgi:hypothetical protein